VTDGAAIVGAGLAGTSHYLALRTVGIPVVGVLSARPERTAEVAAAWRVRAYANLAEVVEDTAVTRVHVCVPIAVHRPVAAAAAAAGKAVACEKPLALGVPDGVELVHAVRDAGVEAHLCFNRRFDRGVQLLRAFLADGDLGEPLMVSGSYQQAFNASPSSFDWRFDPAQIGRSRVVSELGSHWFDLAEHVLRRPLRRLHAVLTFAGERALETGETHAPSSEDAFTALLEFEGGVAGSFFATQLAHGAWDDILLRIDGSLRSAWWYSRRPNEATIAHKREGIRTVGDGSDSRSFSAMIAEVYGGGAAGGPICATLDDGVRNCAALDTVLASASERAWQEVAVP
jgi:predicted dehydrogenase